MINKFIIVGGGTAGWISAIALLKKLENADVILVDKEIDDQIGVGEATLLGFSEFMNDYCEFNDHEWKRELDAVPKAGILIPDWGKEGNDIWHPFSYPNAHTHPTVPPIPMWDALSHFQEENYKDYLSLWPTVATNEVNTHELDYYAWNIDCLKLIRYIENHIKRTYSKFTHIRSTVKDINRSEDGNIASLVCENGQKIDGDFFIDCTGFKSILKDNKDTISLMDEGRLFVDTALAYRIDYDNDLKPFPYAKCPAVEHGWIWKIPLLTRLGTGLLFNRSITDIEEAKDYFVDHWDNKIDRESLRVIDWTPYYDRNIWDKNVLSVGLSAGFFEPLESTGIGLIIGGITTFITSIQGRYFDDYSIDLYNTYIISQCEDIIDFLSMHYGLSERKGKFWDHVRSTWKPSKSLELIANTLDSPHPSSILNTRPAVMFTHNNWNCWLLQLGYPLKPKSIPDPTFAHNCLKRYTDYIIQNRRTSSNTPLSDFLSQIHKK